MRMAIEGRATRLKPTPGRGKNMGLLGGFLLALLGLLVLGAILAATDLLVLELAGGLLAWTMGMILILLLLVGIVFAVRSGLLGRRRGAGRGGRLT